MEGEGFATGVEGCVTLSMYSLKERRVVVLELVVRSGMF